MKNIATAYMARKFSRGGRVKQSAPAVESAPEVEMCAHGGAAICEAGCYDEGVELEEEMGVEPSGDNDEDMLAVEDTRKPDKSRLLSKVLNSLNRRHKGE